MNSPLLESMDNAAVSLRQFIRFRRKVCLNRRNRPPHVSFFFGDHWFISDHRWFHGPYASWLLLEIMALYHMTIVLMVMHYLAVQLPFIIFSHLSIILTCFVLTFYIRIYELPIYPDFDWELDSDEDS